MWDRATRFERGAGVRGWMREEQRHRTEGGRSGHMGLVEAIRGAPWELPVSSAVPAQGRKRDEPRREDRRAVPAWGYRRDEPRREDWHAMTSAGRSSGRGAGWERPSDRFDLGQMGVLGT
jgi:hypothetical protein